MVRSFGGYFGLQTAPTMWGGAPGIWSIRDVSYFQQQGQWPGAGTQFAAVAFTHGPDNIGGAPYLSVYRYLPGNANTVPGGVSTKYPSPSDTVGYKNYGLAFSPDNRAIGAGAGQYNYYNFYRWSDSGFGTRYSSPTDTGNLVIMDIHWNSSSNVVALACSTSGAPPLAYANGVSYTTSLYVYRWDPDNGFGTKYADPVSPSYVPEKTNMPASSSILYSNTYPSTARLSVQGVGGVAITNASDAIIHCNGEAYPLVHAYNFNTLSGFGGKISAPATYYTYSSYYYVSLIGHLQISKDDKYAVLSSVGTDQIAGTIGYYTYNQAFVVTFNNGSSRTFATPLLSYSVGMGLNTNFSGLNVQGRISDKVPFVTKGTTQTYSNVSLLAINFNSGSFSEVFNIVGNTAILFSAASGVYAATDYYGTGVDVTPNGREAVYSYGLNGSIKQAYAPLDRPLTLSSLTRSSVTGVPTLPGNAHKVRFNNFQQDP